MLHDCDFLDHVVALRHWLGFRTSRNPFFLPHGSLGNPEDGPADPEGCHHVGDVQFDRFGLADVGRQPWLGPLEFTLDHATAVGTKEDRAKHTKQRKAGGVDRLSPYSAAVVNDPTLLPPPKTSSPTRRGGPSIAGLADSTTDASKHPPTTITVDVERIVPTLVSRDDARRVEAARQALAEEESRVSAAIMASAKAEQGEGRPLSTALGALATHRESQGLLLSTCDSKRKRPSHPLMALENDRNTREKVPHRGTVSLDVNGAWMSPRTPRSSLRSLALTAAGLVQQLPPKPHPGLGPVLLQSSLPGGDLHPRPFVHTVIDACNSKFENVGLGGTIVVPVASGQTGRDQCSTAPSMPTSTSDHVEGKCRRRPSRRKSAYRRVVSAPATMPGGLTSRTPVIPPPEHSKDNKACPQGMSQGCVGLGPSASTRLSFRKAGSELRALTAAGTTGRRQPPPREVRLRRLARDVQRYSAELRDLARTEEQLRKGLACFDMRPREGSTSRERGSDVEGSPTDERVPPKSSVGSQDGGHSAELSGVGDATHENETAKWQPFADPSGSRGDELALQHIRSSIGEVIEPSNDVFTSEKRYRSACGGHGVGFDRAKASTGSPAERIKALLEATRLDIESKTFHLGIKRDELGCLQMVQTQERERKRALEVERRRLRLGFGQVRPPLLR